MTDDQLSFLIVALTAIFLVAVCLYVARPKR